MEKRVEDGDKEVLKRRKRRFFFVAPLPTFGWQIVDFIDFRLGN